VKTLLAIVGFALSVALIAEAGFALPRASSIERSPAVELVGFGCNFVNGKLVCGKSESSDDADDEDNQKHMQDDEDDNHKHKKKAKDTGDELTECTIQQGPGGGGCVKGFKHVCQKLKSGKKCCGCVPDKNAQAPANVPETPTVDQASCAKEGLQYVAGAGDKCYCPNGFVNKATGLLVATHRNDCVTAKSYNQLDSTGAQTTPATPKQVCCSADIFGPDHKKKGGTAGCSDSEGKAKTRIENDFAASQGGTEPTQRDILGQITCGEPH
jgi:hypothetical protein